MSYLRVHKISRTTADRYVHEHEENLNPVPTNRPTGAITEPSEADVKQFFQHILPRLRSTLTTADSTFYFVREMAFELATYNAEFTDKGILVLGPMQKGDEQRL